LHKYKLKSPNDPLIKMVRLKHARINLILKGIEKLEKENDHEEKEAYQDVEMVEHHEIEDIALSKGKEQLLKEFRAIKTLEVNDNQ